MDSQAQQAFWTVIGNIPPGKVLSYGRVAAMAGYPNHARAVGRCLKQLPKDSRLPWHRVVNAQGRLSFPLGSPSYNEQQQRLAQEGLELINGKLKLASCLWP